MEVNGATVTDYVYFGRAAIAIRSGSAYTDLIYAGGTLLAEVAGTQTAVPTYRATNHLGSLVGVAPGTGSLTGAMNYAPFGQTYSGSTTDTFGYAGLQWDATTATNHATFRQLSIQQGRRQSPDPYSGSYNWADPQSLNRYAYVLNNPLAYTDPIGLTDCYAFDVATEYPDGQTILSLYTYCPSSGGGGGGGYTNYNWWSSYGPTGGGGSGGGGGGGSSTVAPNNGPTFQQKNKACLNTINNSPDGKFYNYFSYASPLLGPDAGWDAAIHDAASEGAQRGTLGFFKATAKNWGRTALGSGSGFVAGVWETVDGVVLTPLAIAATAGQVTVHAGWQVAHSPIQPPA